MQKAQSEAGKATQQCWGCHKRRLVCDLTLPNCNKCVKAGFECPGYDERKPLQWLEPGKVLAKSRKKDDARKKGVFRDGRSEVKEAAKRKTRKRGIVHSPFEIITWNLLDSPVPLPSLEQHDVSLLRFYASRTSLTLASSRTLEIWQSHALEDVKSHTYVMHGILALSALHQCYIEPIHSARYASLASRHHESAAMTFRAQVADISPGNSHTVAIFTLLMAIFSYGVPSVRGFPADISPISMFVNVLGVVRQAWSALGPERQKIEQGFLRPILDPHMSPRRPLGDDSQQLLEDLQAYLETSDDTPENKAAYLEAMIQLEGYFWRLPNFSPLSDVFGWPMIVSDRFFQLLIDKKPFALFCLAYIMVPLYHSPNVWLGPWALPILKEIWVTLDEPLRRFIDWPAQYLRLLPHAAHPKECQCFDCYIEEKSPGFVWKEHAAPLLSRTASL